MLYPYRKILSEEEVVSKFLSLTKTDDSGCVLWQKGLSKQGYGRMMIKGKHFYAHRISFKIFIGEIPKGLFVCHTCDVRSCVNPNHLFLGTQKDNMSDCTNKNRTPKGSMHYSSKLNEEKVIKIRKLYEKKEKRKYELARLFGITQGAIYSIIKRKTWKHI